MNILMLKTIREKFKKKKKKDFDTTFLMKKSRQKTRKTKSMIEFDASLSRSVKSLAAIKKKINKK